MTGFIRPAVRPLTAAFALIAIYALATPPAVAQENNSGLTRRSDAQKTEDAAIDRAYRAATRGDKAIPATKVDPWRVVRPGDEEKRAKR